MDEQINLTPSPEDLENSAEAVDVVELTMDKFLDTAGVDMVYGQPVNHGDTVIIPCAEVVTGMGFGVGYGMGSSNQPEEGEKPAMGGSGGGGGGGGGGRTFSRPVAVVIASPAGVRVDPVVDVTKVALAMFTTLGFMFGMLARMRRGSKPDLEDL